MDMETILKGREISIEFVHRGIDPEFARKVLTHQDFLREQVLSLESANAKLQAALTAELNNRCCGNCAYFDNIAWGTDSGETICSLFEHKPRERKFVYQDSDPCEFWRSCRE